MEWARKGPQCLSVPKAPSKAELCQPDTQPPQDQHTITTQSAHNHHTITTQPPHNHHTITWEDPPGPTSPNKQTPMGKRPQVAATGVGQQTGCHGASRGTIVSVQGWDTSCSILRVKPDIFWSQIPCRSQTDLTGSFSWIKTPTKPQCKTRAASAHPCRRMSPSTGTTQTWGLGRMGKSWWCPPGC